MRQLESAVKEKDKTESGNIASSLVANFLEQEFIMSPEQSLDLSAGTHRISVLVTKDAGDVSALRVEILDGAAVAVP